MAEEAFSGLLSDEGLEFLSRCLPDLLDDLNPISRPFFQPLFEQVTRALNSRLSIRSSSAATVKPLPSIGQNERVVSCRLRGGRPAWGKEQWKEAINLW